MIGYIYKIYDNTNGNIYYGSTKESVSKRITKHRNNYKCFIAGKSVGYTKSFDILKNNDYSYNVVEKVEFNEKFELHQRERYYIENNECVNKCIPNRTSKEYKEDNKDKNKEYREINKDKNKEYREINKDKIREKKKEYRENNKDKIKEYYEKNKERINEKKKEYYEKNKDKIKEHYEKNKERINEKHKEKSNCPHCNKKMRKDTILKHIKNVCKKINNVD